MEMSMGDKLRILVRLFFKLWWMRLKYNVRHLPDRWAELKEKRVGRPALKRPRRERPLPEWKQVPIPREIRGVKPWLGPSLVLFDLIIIAVIAYGLFLIFSSGPKPDLADERLQLEIPAVAPTAVDRVQEDPWEEHIWLSQEEARSLREQPNVINLALLENGGALYSEGYSVYMVGGKEWERSKPYGFSGLSVEGTAIVLQAHGHTYYLNVYQPFVFERAPQQVLIVDQDGRLWMADLAKVELQKIQEVLEALPLQVAPNPNQSFSYRR